MAAARVSGGSSPIGDLGGPNEDDPGDLNGGTNEGELNGGTKGWIKVSNRKKPWFWGSNHKIQSKSKGEEGLMFRNLNAQCRCRGELLEFKHPKEKVQI